MKILLNEQIRLISKHNSSNQLQFGKGRAYRSTNYRQNANEMIRKFMDLNINIPDKVPLGVCIKYYYPRPKKGGLPITRHTKDLDSTKSVLDSLMKAGQNLNLSRGIKSTMFDDSQVVIELLEKDYWDDTQHGLDIKVIQIEPSDDMQYIKENPK